MIAGLFGTQSPPQRTRVLARGPTEGGDVFSVIAMAMVTVLLALFSRLGESGGGLLGVQAEQGVVEEQSPSAVTEGAPGCGIPPGTTLVPYHSAHLGTCSLKICPEEADLQVLGGRGMRYG